MGEYKLMTCRYLDQKPRPDSHFHNAYEVVYVVDGLARIRVNHCDYEVGRDHLVFISNFEEHHSMVLTEPYKRYFATFDSEKLDRLLADPSLTSILKNRPTGFDHCVDMSGRQALLRPVFELFVENSGREDDFSAKLIVSALRVVLLETYRQLGVDRNPAPPELSNEVYKVQRYIEAHFAEDISITRIAQEHYINPYYLSHSFKKMTGYSPKQFLLLTRLARAKELLTHTTLPVGEISYKAGFSDVNNFIRYFKREVGVTPNKFRRI